MRPRPRCASKLSAGLLVAVVAGLCAPRSAPTQVIPLQLHRALPIEGLDSAQPSGLTIVDGQLFAVSDQHDHAVCRIRLQEERALLEPYITFNAPWSGAWARSLDFEGLAYLDGSFFLVSEAILRVLRVHETGGDLAWVIPTVEEVGREAGLFNEKNARLEGLAMLGGGRLVLAAERAPRGLIEVVLDPRAPEPIAMAAYTFSESILTLPEPREADFSDLFYDGVDLYALSRNAEAVVRIEYDADELFELEVWPFAHVTNAPEYRYEDRTYGKAEGLCMDEDFVYVVLDNNGQTRETDPSDARPLLLVFHRP
jgi:hypothetical protein